MSPEKAVEILLVEDNPADLELTLRALQERGLANAIEVARDGEEALDFILRRGAYKNRPPHQPRLVLLDLKLPKVDGLEVLKVLKGNPATKAIPVVILTSSKEEHDLVEGYMNGTNSYIQKPVNFDEFRETVRNLGLYWMVVNERAPEKAFGRAARSAKTEPC